jgi:hypothetical protein
MPHTPSAIPAALLLCTAAVPASAAMQTFEGFSGSFLRTFIAYALLFLGAHLVSFLLTFLGVTRKDPEEAETVRATDDL